MAQSEHETEPAHDGEHRITYAETNPEGLVMDPWATASNLFFLLVAGYWAWRSGLRYKRHPLIVAGLPVLVLGFFGGSMFHAVRGRIWLMLDVLPILTLCILAALHFWRTTLERWWTAYLIGLIAPLVVIFGLASIFQAVDAPFRIRIPVMYSLMALTVICPTVYHAYRHRWEYAGWLVAGIGGFVAALLCRSIDEWAGQYVPMGTHFLWHVFGAVATFCVLAYVYHTDRMDAPEVTNSAPGTEPARQEG